jgi:hypothetical protein
MLVFNNKILNFKNRFLVNKGDNLFIKSKNILSDQGFQVGAFVTKDMTSGSIAPSSSNMAVFPGTIRPSSYTASIWVDWGQDIFDNWGYFYLYDYTTNSYSPIVFSPINQSDGVISNQNINSFGRNFIIKHGYPVQGIFKIDISVNDDLDFSFGATGNMGSDSLTSNANLTENFLLNNENFVLHYNYNFQTNITTEAFYTYIIPYEKEKNKQNINFTKGVAGNDWYGFYVNPIKYGVTIYFSKRFNVKDWVINDLEKNN